MSPIKYAFDTMFNPLTKSIWPSYIMTKKYIISFAISCFILLVTVLPSKPPFNSPDEGTHLFRADSLTHGYISLNPLGPDTISDSMIDSNLAKSMMAFSQPLTNPSVDGFNKAIDTMDKLYWTKERTDVSLPTTSYYLPIIYAPQVTSLFIGKILNLSIYKTYLLVNVISFLSCAIILLIANQIYKIPLFTLVIISIPMSIYQLLSPTIDGLSLSLTILAMSIFFELQNSDSNRNQSLLLILMSACIIIAIGSRANLIAMVLLPAWLYFTTKKRIYLTALSLTIIITFAWIIHTLSNASASSLFRHPGFTNSQIVSYYLTHPKDLIKITYGTITNFDYISFYIESFIGKLGRLDIDIPESFRNTIIVSIFIVFLSSFILGKFKEINRTHFFVFIISICSIALVFAALLIQWTPFPTNYIEGIQGRYFIIPVSMLGYCLPKIKSKTNFIYLVVLLTAIFSTYTIVDSLNQKNSTISIPDNRKINEQPGIVNIESNEEQEFKIEVDNGKLKEISILMANYQKKADGLMYLTACSKNTCEESSLEVKGLKDNSFYKFKLPRDLLVEDNSIKLKLRFIQNKKSSPLAIRVYKYKDTELGTTPKLMIVYN